MAAFFFQQYPERSPSWKSDLMDQWPPVTSYGHLLHLGINGWHRGAFHYTDSCSLGHVLHFLSLFRYVYVNGTVRLPHQLLGILSRSKLAHISQLRQSAKDATMKIDAHVTFYRAWCGRCAAYH